MTLCRKQLKNLFYITVSLIVAACGNNQGSGSDPKLNPAQYVARYSLDKQCHSQLEKRKEWQAAALFMKKDRKKQIADNICSCAATEISSRLETGDILKLLSEEERKKRIQDLSAETIAVCIGKLVK